MLFIVVNNEHHMLVIYQVDFTNDLPKSKLLTRTLPGRFHKKIAS